MCESPFVIDANTFTAAGSACVYMMTCSEDELLALFKGPWAEKSSLHNVGCPLCGERVARVLHSLPQKNVPAAIHPRADAFVRRHIFCG